MSVTGAPVHFRAMIWDGHSIQPSELPLKPAPVGHDGAGLGVGLVLLALFAAEVAALVLMAR
jgi:hypothetical protein